MVNDAMKKLLHADDLALATNGKQELATGDNSGVERFVYQTRAESEPREDGSAAHIYATRGKSWTSSWRERNGINGTVSCIREGLYAVTGRRRERFIEECRPERTHGEQLQGGDGRPADLKKTEG